MQLMVGSSDEKVYLYRMKGDGTPRLLDTIVVDTDVENSRVVG